VEEDMSKLSTRIFLGAFLSLSSLAMHANAQKDLENAFNKITGVHNISSAYHSQSAGHYSGGSVFARNQIRNQQIMHINLPKVGAGCGGIDLYLGGISYIKKKEAITLAKEVMNNAGAYAFNLALESVSPMISNTMKDLRNVATTINNASINSCELATGLVGSVFPKTEAAQKQVCQDIGTSSGYVDDYASARMDCANATKRKDIFDTAKKNGYDNYLTGSLNFAWKAIKTNDLFKNDNELSEVMMSLSGTIVYKYDKEGNKDSIPQKNIYSSLAVNADFLKSLLEGGEVEVYGCDAYLPEQCLNPVLKKITIAKEASLKDKVENLIGRIVTKIREGDEPLTDDEKGFIQSTSLPVFKMLNVQSAFMKDLSSLNVTSYSELIASDILYQYLDESLNSITDRARTLQLPENEYKEFISSLDRAKRIIRQRKLDTYEMRSGAIQMIEQTMLIEKKLSSQVQTPISDALTWSDNL
tara:strand:+ start:36 stop:1451 length:1416 start_codon:yes stop_codon:yes gene_type:complete